MQRTLHLLLGVALLGGSAVAQGNNTCSDAQPISGLGTFAFNNAGATTDGSPAAACDKFGTNQISNDVWFEWTAPTTDDFTVETCGGTGLDTKIAAYSGTSCPTGAPLDCNDDTCGLQSQVNFSGVAGNVYLFRIGTFSAAAFGSGTFSVAEGGGPPTGGCDNPAIGPDVIVGDLSGMSNYGGVGGIGAYSIGTTSCNVGDAELDWIAGNVNHPVIGQNVYRHKDGRFELLGISWLKHGFTALQGSLCCDCIASGTGSRLGVGCSDPYGSGLNGSQGGLGPRFQVNAHTGGFVYPFSGQGQGGNEIFKRIQIANSDVDPSQNAGATYYAEGHYIAPDDATAGNGNNNASWENINVGGFSNGAWSLGTTGATNRGEPAIRAWQVVDPTVQLEDVQIPNEGLFIVGSKATSNGNGTWDYEYAIHNLNSDRSGGSFSVPVPAGVSVTNVGFHDVDYHSGEPFSGTDWPGTRNTNDVTWSTQSFSTNSNANALRWGTLYNFRFTANTAPVSASATLGLFKPGTPNSASVDVQAPDGGAPPTSNFCQTSPNSVGSGAVMSSSGTTSITDNTFTVEATGSIPNGFGLFYYGPQEVQQTFGNGFRCVGAGATGTFRLQPAMMANGFGDAARLVDFSTAPAGAGTGVINSGSTWKFQWWYRDPSAGGAEFNLSDGLSATFQP